MRGGLIRSGADGPLITAATVNKPAYSTAGLGRTFEVGVHPASLREPAGSWLSEDSPARYSVEFYGLVIGPPPPSKPREFIHLRFDYPAN